MRGQRGGRCGIAQGAQGWEEEEEVRQGEQEPNKGGFTNKAFRIYRSLKSVLSQGIFPREKGDVLLHRGKNKKSGFAQPGRQGRSLQ